MRMFTRLQKILKRVFTNWYIILNSLYAILKIKIMLCVLKQLCKYKIYCLRLLPFWNKKHKSRCFNMITIFKISHSISQTLIINFLMK